MENFGKAFKEAREKLGLSLEEAAQRTKIHLHKLKSIEEGKIDELPAKVFSLGLIKSYGRELKMDPEQVSLLCEQAFSVEKADEPGDTPGVEKELMDEAKPLGQFQIPKFLVFIFCITLSLSLISGIYFMSEKMNSYSQEESETPTLIAPSDPENSPEIEKDQPTITEEKRSVPEIQENITPLAPEKVSEEKPKNSSEQMNPTQRQIEEEPLKPSDNKLTVEALGALEVEIRWSDGYLQTMSLEKGDKKTLVFTSPINIKIQNPDNAQVIFNLKPYPLPKGEQNTEFQLP